MCVCVCVSVCVCVYVCVCVCGRGATNSPLFPPVHSGEVCAQIQWLSATRCSGAACLCPGWIARGPEQVRAGAIELGQLISLRKLGVRCRGKREKLGLAR